MDLDRRGRRASALWIVTLALLLAAPGAALAQEQAGDGDASEAQASEANASPEEGSESQPRGGSAFDAESYVALSADQDAQESLGGFRRYLERTREADTDLYRVLDARLQGLESRETSADIIFWTATALGAASLIAAIPVHETLGLDPAIGFMVAGGGVFLLGVLIQAIVRPGRGDLVELIDLHDQRLGRR